MLETFDRTISFADFEVDAARRRLSKKGETVALNPKAFDLLLTLIENRGRLLSKDELLESVWANQFVEENNLTVHISALRKTLGEKKGENLFIVTVPGKGYKFVAEVRMPVEEKARRDLAENSTSRQISDANNSNGLVVIGNALPGAASNEFETGESLIGRSGETAEIKNLLRQNDINLVTLTGAGGSGKTSLARRVAAELRENFPDGVFFVELAAASETELVVSAIAQTLNVTESSGKSLVESIKDFVRERRVLLVLDNFEQILPAAPVVKEFLAASSSLKVLVTSRAALRLKVEREFSVLPLDLPPPNAAFSIDQFNEYPAIALFCKRACAVKPNFTLTAENARAVAEICRRLDGLPLAIELAAARVKLLAPSAILDRLENSLKLLTGGAKDSPERQRTMRDTIRWSYELLDENEKFLFRRLAIFAGGFTVEAAEAVAEEENRDNLQFISASPHLSISASQTNVLDLLNSLIDNNLLVSKEQADGNARLQMLEVVREFALECLEASGETEVVRRRHSEFFLSLAAEAEPHLSGGQAVDWLEKLETEHDNLRHALGWQLEREPEKAAQMTAALRQFWTNRSHLTEARRWLEAALEKSDAAPTATRLKLLNAFSLVARNQGDYAATRRASEESLTASRAINDSRQIILACHAVAGLEIREGNLAAARKLFEESLIISRKLNDEKQIAISLSGLGNLFLAEGKASAARTPIEESLALTRRLGFNLNVSVELINLGVIAYYEDDIEEAHRHFAESLKICREMGNKLLVSCCLEGFAAVAVGENAEQSAKLAGAAESLREAIGYEMEITERLFRDDYLRRVRVALDEKRFAALYAQGRAMNADEAVALAVNRQLPEKSRSANGNRANEFTSEYDGQSEIIIENHSFSRIIIEETDYKPAYETIETKTLNLKTDKNRFGLPKIIYASLAVALLTGLLLAFWFWNSSGISANGNQFNLSKLTTSGKVTSATLTPDSKYAVFAQTETDGESLWLRHISTGSQKQILPAQAVRFVGLAVAPDGNQIYATTFSPALSDPQIWRVPLLGGSTEEIKGITTGAAVTFSPDGKYIAFVESRSPINENHLMISDADGANKRIVLRTQGDTRSLTNFNANPVAWSPEGSEIACAVDEKNSAGAMKAGIVLVNAEDGSERFVSEKRWDYLENLTWTDAENLAFVAYTNEPWQSQVWTISKRTGEARQITKDLNSYSWLASANGNLLTVQKNAVSYISTGNLDEKTNRIEQQHEIYNESGFIECAVWANDGAVLYTSSANGKREIWRVENNGSNPAQLTAGANVAFGFAVSPVDGSIVFSANENGRYSLKLMNADGKNIRSLTEGTEDVYPNFTADGQTIVFQRGIKNKLFTMWRVSLTDKNPVQITRTHGTQPAISPDGTQVAHYFMDAETDNVWRIRLVSTSDGAIFGKLSFPKSVTERRMRWHPSGRFISQIFYEGDNIKLLNLPIGGGEAQIVSDFGKGSVNWLDWSRDGRQIVVSHTTATQDVVFLSK